MSEKEITEKQIWFGIFLVVILVGGYTIANQLLKKESPPIPPNDGTSTSTPVIVAPQPSQYPDYDALKGSNADPNIKSVNIIFDCQQGGCINNKPATQDFDGVAHTYKVTGKLSRAYLYADLAVDYKRPLTSWDDFFASLGSYGGHIILDDNLLPVPPGQDSRYLFNLNSISYYPSLLAKNNKSAINNINVFSIFQNGNTFDIHVTISSNRPGRVMKEVLIYYECFQGSNCSIDKIK